MSPQDENENPAGQTDDDGWATAARESVPAGQHEDASSPAEIGPEGANASTGANTHVSTDTSPGASTDASTDTSPGASTGASPGASTGAPEKPARAVPTKPGRPDRTSADQDIPGPPRAPLMSRRTLIALIAAGLFLVLVLVFWLLGRHNGRSYHIVCGDPITAERGRSFPPWGTSRLSGEKWRPIELVVKLGPCDDTTVTSREELEARYRDLLLWQADAWLQQHDGKSAHEQLATVRAQLEQAVSSSRGSDDRSMAARERIARLLGDVAYWEVRDQTAKIEQQLALAAERMGAAVEQDPVHVRGADEWREHLVRLQQELVQGPPALRPPGAAGIDSSDARQQSTAGNGASAFMPRDVELEPPDAGASTPDSAPGSAPGTPADQSQPARDEPGVPNPPPPGSGTLL